MPSLNPAVPARNFIRRMRQMDDTLHALDHDVRKDLESLRAEVASLTEIVRSASTEINDSREIVGVAARRLTFRRERIRVVFLVHNATAWGSIAEIAKIMFEESDFDPIVVSIPHHYSGIGPPKGEAKVHQFLTDAGIPHLRMPRRQLASASELLRGLDPDIIIRQSQWDADIDTPFSTEALSWTRMLLVPYETMNTTENAPFGNPHVNSAVDTAFHRAAWLVFVANGEALTIAQRDALTGGVQFRAVGHPKLDYVRGAAAAWPFHEGSGKRRQRILWSAHHSILEGWNDFGMFPQIHADMLAWARESPDVEFVFTHHPLLPATIRRVGSPVSATEYDDWLHSWTTMENATVWRSDYAGALTAADILVTDGPSMMIEGQLAGKPTVFLEREDHIPFNRIGIEIAKGVHRVPDVESARRVVDELERKGVDDLSSIQAQNVDRFFGQPGAARRIVDTIRDEVAAERLHVNLVR